MTTKHRYRVIKLGDKFRVQRWAKENCVSAGIFGCYPVASHWVSWWQHGYADDLPRTFASTQDAIEGMEAIRAKEAPPPAPVVVYEDPES